MGMSNKNEFSKLAEDVDKKFKKIEQKRERVQEVIKAGTPEKPLVPMDEKRQKKLKDHKKLEKFRIKEKLIHAVIVFVLGHCLLVPMYLKYPQYAANMFLFASISLGVICVAVIDYT